MGNNCHKSPELLIEKGEKYFHFLLVSECVRRASACLCAEALPLRQFLGVGLHTDRGYIIQV
jgi:hypothetical protein